jgi:hypothetical protein
MITCAPAAGRVRRMYKPTASAMLRVCAKLVGSQQGTKCVADKMSVYNDAVAAFKSIMIRWERASPKHVANAYNLLAAALTEKGFFSKSDACLAIFTQPLDQISKP